MVYYTHVNWTLQQYVRPYSYKELMGPSTASDHITHRLPNASSAARLALPPIGLPSR